MCRLGELLFPRVLLLGELQAVLILNVLLMSRSLRVLLALFLGDLLLRKIPLVLSPVGLDFF
jgi:hypothetical protein